jgi:hypothetical protein
MFKDIIELRELRDLPKDNLSLERPTNTRDSRSEDIQDDVRTVFLNKSMYPSR